MPSWPNYDANDLARRQGPAWTPKLLDCAAASPCGPHLLRRELESMQPLADPTGPWPLALAPLAKVLERWAMTAPNDGGQMRPMRWLGRHQRGESIESILTSEIEANGNLEAATGTTTTTEALKPLGYLVPFLR